MKPTEPQTERARPQDDDKTVDDWAGTIIDDDEQYGRSADGSSGEISWISGEEGDSRAPGWGYDDGYWYDDDDGTHGQLEGGTGGEGSDPWGPALGDHDGESTSHDDPLADKSNTWSGSTDNEPGQWGGEEATTHNEPQLSDQPQTSIGHPDEPGGLNPTTPTRSHESETPTTPVAGILVGVLLVLLGGALCAWKLCLQEPARTGPAPPPAGPKPGKETELARFERMSTMSTTYGDKKSKKSSADAQDEKKGLLAAEKLSMDDEEAGGGWDDWGDDLDELDDLDSPSTSPPPPSSKQTTQTEDLLGLG